VFTRAFRYERAERYSDACDLLREHGEEAKVLAGGQSLLPLINLGLVQPGLVVDISRLADVDTPLTGCPVTDLAGRVGTIQGISPADDTSASAQYRARLTRVLVIQALTEAAERAGQAA